MNINIRNLIIDGEFDKLNRLIKLGVIKMDDALNEVYNLNDGKYFYNFAYFVEFASKDKLVKRLIATKNAEYIFKFARDIIGAPIDELALGIIATKNAEYIYEFARRIKGAPIEKLALGIASTYNGCYIIYFAEFIHGAPIEKLAEAIAGTNDANNISYFILYIDEISLKTLKKLVEALLKTNDEECICEFISNIDEDLKEKLSKAFYPINIMEQLYQKLVASKDITYIRSLLDTDETIIKIILQYITDTKDEKFVYNCMHELGGIFAYQFFLEIVELKDFEAISKLLIELNFEDEKPQTKFDICLLENIDLLLGAMEECKDIQLLQKVFNGAKLPIVKSYLKILILGIEESSSILSEEEKMNLLTVLYNNEDFATIRKYREVFSSLFQDKGESLGRN